MSAYVITIDCGTTNTRVVLWNGAVVAATARSEAGVRDTAKTGSSEFLARAVAGCLQDVVSKAGITPESVAAVLASGMITSNIGLKEIPHLIAPAGIRELASGMAEVSLPSVWPKPMWFIPGVRPNPGKVAPDEVPDTDMMRGEETEVIALLETVQPALPCWLALPGSHSKYIPVDGQGRILGSLSTLTGEMFQALATQTILASSVDMGADMGVDMAANGTGAEWLVRGFAAAREFGLGRALYCTRLSQLWTDSSVGKRTAHLLGAIMESDVHLLRGSPLTNPDMPIWVTGRGELKKALVTLLRHDGFFKNIMEAPEGLENLAALGAMAVARVRGVLGG